MRAPHRDLTERVRQVEDLALQLGRSMLRMHPDSSASESGCPRLAVGRDRVDVAQGDSLLHTYRRVDVAHG
eukprot:7446251-Heterocapsa_arctica.AAC.1